MIGGLIQVPDVRAAAYPVPEKDQTGDFSLTL
jgi:hypothetical protein